MSQTSYIYIKYILLRAFQLVKYPERITFAWSYELVYFKPDR